MIETYGPSGLLERLAAEGIFMESPARRLSKPVHQGCHTVAHAYWAQCSADWWLGCSARTRLGTARMGSARDSVSDPDGAVRGDLIRLAAADRLPTR